MGHKNTFQPLNIHAISLKADERKVSALYPKSIKEGGERRRGR